MESFPLLINKNLFFNFFSFAHNFSCKSDNWSQFQKFNHTILKYKYKFKKDKIIISRHWCYAIEKRGVEDTISSKKSLFYSKTRTDYRKWDSCQQLGNGKYGRRGKRLHKKYFADCISLRLLHNATSPAGILHGSVHRLTCITRVQSLVMQAASVSHEV